jgi:hypothetical protein
MSARDFQAAGNCIAKVPKRGGYGLPLSPGPLTVLRESGVGEFSEEVAFEGFVVDPVADTPTKRQCAGDAADPARGIQPKPSKPVPPAFVVSRSAASLCTRTQQH